MIGGGKKEWLVTQIQSSVILYFIQQLYGKLSNMVSYQTKGGYFSLERDTLVLGAKLHFQG